MCISVDENEALAARLVAMLTEKALTLATAESCTGGLVAKYITDQPGASVVFGTGLVTYANSAKIRLLGVPEDLLAKWGAVSEPVARAMASGARRTGESDIGLGITGVAGPGGGTEEKPLGLVHMAVAFRGGMRHFVMQPQGGYPGRDVVRHKAAACAMRLVLECVDTL